MKKLICLFTLLAFVCVPFAQAQKTARKGRRASAKKDMTGTVAPQAQKALAAQADVSVEALPQAGAVAVDATPQVPQEGAQPVLPVAGDAPAVPAAEGEGFVAPREEVAEKPEEAVAPRVVYNPKSRRDPTLSPDDFLLLQFREQQRLAAIEAERQRKLAEERRKREEEERLRQLELARIKDPTREVRNRIKIGGIIGQEVFIGSKIYTVGKSIYGARIVEVRPDSVVFSYKGHKFVRKMQL